MAKASLTAGALCDLMSGNNVDNPIVQVLGSKKIDSSTPGKDRFRLLLSDGKYMINCVMYNTQPSDQLVVGGEIAEYTVIKLKRHICSSVSTSRDASQEVNILVILEAELVKEGKSIGEKIGSPQSLPSNLAKLEKKLAPSTSAGNPDLSVKMTAMSPIQSKPGPVANTSDLAENLIMPLNALSPYQNRWVVKVRVVNKAPVRNWSNSRGEGKLFSFDIIDDTDEMRVTGFGESVHKYFDFIQVDKVYYISKCQIKLANKRFSSLANDYEMTLGAETVIQLCNESSGKMPQIKYNFTTIEKIVNLEVNTMIDIIAVCKHAGEVLTFTAKTTNRELVKRDVTLVDQSKASVSLTLWGQDAQDFDNLSQVIVVKGARVSEYAGGKTLSVPNGTTIKINPDIQEAFVLRGWYDNGGSNEDGTNISARTGGGPAKWMQLDQLHAENFINAERGEYFQTVATILFTRSENLVYKACMNDGCNKKVVDQGNDSYRCEKCNIDSPNFKYRLIGKMNMADCSGSHWVNVFNNELEFIAGRTAAEIGPELDQPNNRESLSNFVQACNFQRFLFRCFTKLETYNDDTRLQTVVVKAEKINYKTYNAHLISEIQEMMK